jgi:NAD(P)-dependent dehydrogenase (short-subunit alcohol dehydrogenase family)
MTNSDLENSIVVVTGGGSGIGRACCELLSSRGATVVVADLSLSTAQQVSNSLPKSEAYAIDVSNDDDVRSMFADVLDRFGRLDIAVNNAGIGVPEKLNVADVSLEAWREIMAINLDGVFHCMRWEIKAMLASGGGSIVNMASVMGSVAIPGASPYIAAKHAVVGLTRAAAAEYAFQGIRVNAVGPAFIDTPLLAYQSAEARAKTEKAHPMNRLGTAMEIAEVVAFLASPASSFVTGAYYLADGGYTAI